MAHNIKIKPVPHINKDGSVSASKKDYKVLDRHRGKTMVVGVGSSMKAAENLLIQHRRNIVEEHLTSHPNDSAFIRKHGLVGISKEN